MLSYQVRTDRLNVSRFSKPLKCMNLKDNDELVSVDISDGSKGIITVTKAGYGTLYSEDEISVLGVKAGGVKGINMRDDEVAFMSVFSCFFFITCFKSCPF